MLKIIEKDGISVFRMQKHVWYKKTPICCKVKHGNFFFNNVKYVEPRF